MQTFTAPTRLNGQTLLGELATAGVVVTDPPSVTGDELTLAVTEADRPAVEAVLAAHTGAPSPWVANDATLRDQAKTNIAALRTSIDTLQAITDKTNANIGPADTKTVARETRRVARQLVVLTRLFLGELDSIDIGTA